ncbi:MAG: prolipoprotein diacylglyceryl transferase [Polyangiaceae bacterium]|nr:prolipoprotein diacylglyceryl transferase [Polyangiaceae bacterium]
MAPLIPFIKVPEIPLSFLEHIPLLGDFIDPAHPPSIKPFGTLVALGVYIGAIVATRHAKERGLDVKKMSEYIFWVVGIGFIGGHVFDAIFYHPARVAREPLYLFKLWDGLSSYGGFVGAMIGAFAWRLYRNEKILPYSECINSAFPLAWVFGRAGCATVHDHPGKLSDAWFAVKWPLGEGYIGRYDLGLIEMVLTIPLAVSFLILWHRRPFRPLGFYTGVMCIAYAPVRFILDFFREQEGAGLIGGDPRYGGLTPAQWASMGLVLLGIFFLRIAYGSGSKTGEPAAFATAGGEPISSGGDAPEEAADSDEDEGEEEPPPKPTRRRSRSRGRRD